MNKLTLLLFKHFMYSMKDIDYDWNLLTDKEQEIFENEATFNIVVRESKIQVKS